MFGKLYNPEIFQGNLGKKKYFEGWYFKHVDRSKSHVSAIIPGVSISGDSHAFIQVLDGVSGESHYFRFPIETFLFNKRDFSISISSNDFSLSGIALDLHDHGMRLQGKLTYHRPIKYPKKILSLGIMGWYSFVPFMECYHGVASISHSIKGSFMMNGDKLDFDEGNGYIEKDWGKSFPSAWIWLQANSFDDADASIMISVAKIPWLGSSFTGFLCFLYVDGGLHRFMTYNNSRLISASLRSNGISIELERKKSRIRIAARSKISGNLQAPALGIMDRRIKESVDSTVHIELLDGKARTVFEGTSERVGLEIAGDPKSLFPSGVIKTD